MLFSIFLNFFSRCPREKKVSANIEVLRVLATFAKEQEALDAPVILTGDMNATSFTRLRGIACVVALLKSESLVHPFSFDCADVPTMPTSVTTARQMRIDTIMYQSRKVSLVDVSEHSKLSQDNPIPNEEHPSDHIPICATFRLQSRLVMSQWCA